MWLTSLDYFKTTTDTKTHSGNVRAAALKSPSVQRQDVKRITDDHGLRVRVSVAPACETVKPLRSKVMLLKSPSVDLAM